MIMWIMKVIIKWVLIDSIKLLTGEQINRTMYAVRRRPTLFANVILIDFLGFNVRVSLISVQFIFFDQARLELSTICMIDGIV